MHHHHASSQRRRLKNTLLVGGLVCTLVAGIGIFGCQKSRAQKALNFPDLPEIPNNLPSVLDNPGKLFLKNGPEGGELTIVPEIQGHIENFVQSRGNPIAATVVVDVKTGDILAMVQGQQPERWGGTTHSALHPGFPSASLFKTVVTAAAFEFSDVDSEAPIGLTGGCAHVGATGIWMRKDTSQRADKMTLRRAYGHSCNGFFAKIAINRIGLGSILAMAQRFGWNGSPIPADFKVPVSRMNAPAPESSSVQTVGRFAAGFGLVGISAVHAAWQGLAVANNGMSKPIKIFKNSPLNNLGPMSPQLSDRVIQPETASRIRSVMEATISGGTASHAFRHGPIRKLRDFIGGKTGTLTGHNPEGLTTLFVGMMPLDNPEVVVASVVVLENFWRFKATNLAAESFLAYADYKKKFSTAAAGQSPETEQGGRHLR